MSKIVIDEERCKGCLICTLVCPKEIIQVSARFNKQGYKVAEVPAGSMDKCTGCATCANLCPDIAITVWKTVKESKKERADV